MTKPVIRVYTKPGCGPCFATKHLFRKLDVDFIEEDATDPNNIAAMKELGYLSAPVVVIGESGDDMWSGFNEARIKEAATRFHYTPEGK